MSYEQSAEIAGKAAYASAGGTFVALERTAWVYGGFFEYKMPDEGVFRLG